MFDDDWDAEPATSPAPEIIIPRTAAKKWADEDAEDASDDDWDKSEDEKPTPKPVAAAPPAKKKGTLKQKLAEKEKIAKERALFGADDDELIDTMTEQDRRRLAREREQEADLAVASELMGDVDLGDEAGDLKNILTAKPTTKNDFNTFSKNVFNTILKKHESNPLYAHLVEQLSKDMAAALTAVQTRKVSSSLSVLGNTKQQEERDKASGKKKTATKPKLGAAKVSGRADTEAYDDVLADDDFM